MQTTANLLLTTSDLGSNTAGVCPPLAAQTAQSASCLLSSGPRTPGHGSTTSGHVFLLIHQVSHSYIALYASVCCGSSLSMIGPATEPPRFALALTQIIFFPLTLWSPRWGRRCPTTHSLPLPLALLISLSSYISLLCLSRPPSSLPHMLDHSGSFGRSSGKVPSTSISTSTGKSTQNPKQTTYIIL